MQSQRGGRGTAPTQSKPNTISGGWLASPFRCFTLGKGPVPIVQETVLVFGGGLDSTDNHAFTGNRSQDRPAGSESINRHVISPWRSGFKSREVHVGFVVDKVPL